MSIFRQYAKIQKLLINSYDGSTRRPLRQRLHWRQQLETGAEGIYADHAKKKEREKDDCITRIYEQVGKLQMQTEWLKKLGIIDE